MEPALNIRQGSRPGGAGLRTRVAVPASPTARQARLRSLTPPARATVNVDAHRITEPTTSPMWYTQRGPGQHKTNGTVVAHRLRVVGGASLFFRDAVPNATASAQCVDRPLVRVDGFAAQQSPAVPDPTCAPMPVHCATSDALALSMADRRWFSCRCRFAPTAPLSKSLTCWPSRKCRVFVVTHDRSRKTRPRPRRA